MHPSLAPISAAAVSLFLITGAAAAGPADPLREALGLLPDGTADGVDWQVFDFADPRVGARAVAANGLLHPMLQEPHGGVLMAGSMGFRDLLLQPDALSRWPALTGIDPARIDWMLLAGQPPHRITAIHLEDRAADAVAPALLANGYAADPDGLYWRGAEDFEIDPARRNIDDPFGGHLGQASRVRILDGTVVRAASRDGVNSVARAGDRTLDRLVPVAVILYALDATLPAEAMILRASGLPDASSLGGPATGQAVALPAWQAGMVVDGLSGADGVLVIALSYDGRDQAVSAAEALAAGWSLPGPVSGRSPRDRTGAEVTTGVTGKGPFVAWAMTRPVPYEMEDLSDLDARNDAYVGFLNLLYRRDLAMLDPAD